jgi:Tfp pilus assembly protein PilF
MTDPKKSRRERLEEMVAKQPNDPFSRYGLALECMNSGDPHAADRHFRELLESNRDYVPGYLMYAQLLARESRAEDAKSVLASGISAARQKGDTHAQSEMQSLLDSL